MLVKSKPISIEFTKATPSYHKHPIEKVTENQLTYCPKPTAKDCWHQIEKASGKITYILFKSEIITLSASCRKGLLDPDLHAVQNPDNSIVSIMQKRPPGP